jgi:hypothetical protein
MREVNIGPASEFADPGRKLIGFERFEVAVFKIGGEPISTTARTWAAPPVRAR